MRGAVDRPSDLQRGREPRPLVARRAPRSPARPARPRRRRRLARRHRRDRRAARRRRCCTARAKAGLGPAYLAGFDRALRAAPVRARDGRRLLPRPGRPPAPARAAARRRPRARLALRRGGGVGDWHAARRVVCRAGCVYARAVLGVPVRDLTGGFKCFRAGALRAIDLATRPLPGLRLPGRADLPRAAARLARRRGPDRLPRARGGRSRCRAGSRWRPPGWCRAELSPLTRSVPIVYW